MECNEDKGSFYQKLIGVLRWIIELGIIYFAFDVSALSIYLAFPGTGHLMQALHIFKDLKIHNTNDIALDPYYQCVTRDQNIKSKFYAMKYLYVDSR